MSYHFENWSGSLRFDADERPEPTSAAEVTEIVRRAAQEGRVVRPVGAGHSSTPLARTSDVLVSLDRMSGVQRHGDEESLVAVGPGTRLHEANRELVRLGLAMPTMGDVDLQAIAGAIATGTHGSGIELNNLSAMLAGGELVTGTGDVVRFGTQADGSAPSEVDDDDLLRAARVGLGALGVLTSLTLRLVAAHTLHRRDWCTHVDWVREHYDELVRTNRSFDMYWYPRSDQAQVRTLNPPGREPTVVPPGPLHTDETGPSHEIIPKSRHLRFDEMEYMLPYDAGLACFREIRDRIRDRHRRTVAWRVLVRTIAADDAPISNCYGRPTMTIALLHNAGLPYEEYFGDLEPVLQAYGGRPHWGKKHTMRADRLRPLFPEWDTFQQVRRALDPGGVFLNDHLRALFEEET